MDKKAVKLIKTETQPVRGLTIQVTPEIYDRLNKMSYDLKITKRALINTAIVKLLDTIEVVGVEL